MPRAVSGFPAKIRNVSLPLRPGSQKAEAFHGGTEIADSIEALPLDSSIETYDSSYHSNFVEAS